MILIIIYPAFVRINHFLKLESMEFVFVVVERKFKMKRKEKITLFTSTNQNTLLLEGYFRILSLFWVFLFNYF
jgi:hypothetical protein